MGWRTTAQNYNLNRDYVKADSPEMQAMLGLINQWDPLVYVDMHVTNGAKFEHDISVQLEPVRSGDPLLHRDGLALRDNVINALQQSGSLARPFYYAFDVEDDPASGFTDSVPTPRFSHGYFPLRNRFAMLVETHSWKDYPTRVRISKNMIMATVGQLAQHGASWRTQAQAADLASSKLAGQPVTLTWRSLDTARSIDFHAYAWQYSHSDISGARMVNYDENRPQRIQVKLRDQVAPSMVLAAPGAGYLIPPALASQMAAKLQQHGIAFRRLQQALPTQAVQAFRASKTEFASQPYEQRNIGAGALFVPIAQPKARLIMTMLEPQCPDSLAAWGFFNQAYEKKEYMEAYVAEEVARAQLAKDPLLAKAFADKLASDPQFAASPEARLEFFARRHPSWDDQYQLYPIFRLAHQP
jgi:hypothetical protein